MRIVPTELIPENAVLADPLYTLDGRVLLKVGAKLTPHMVEKINANSIYTVYINDDHSSGDMNKVVDPHLRHKGMMLIKKIFEAAGHRNTQNEWAPKSIFEFIDELNELTEDVLYDLSSARDIQLDYIDIKNVDNYLKMDPVSRTP